jgi:hypothetical protein
MANTIIEVLLELDNGKEVNCLAKIEEVLGDTYVVRYMSPTKKFFGDQKIYAYEKTTYVIDKSSVSGFFDSEKEEDAGMHKVDGGWVSAEDDSEYTPSNSETETESDISLTASENEED